jgi:hypothetical protein
MLARLMGGIRMSARQKNACCLATLALGAVLVLLLLNSAPARAVSAPTPWDGVNPFDCTIQDAGQGTTVPDPGADPYCVRFDKTNQNIAELGLVDFLSKEPARVAAAVPKCFYYQEDHWRGSLIQSDQQTVVYEFYGHYFFNKATGDGGVYVSGFTVAGQTFDPRTLPGFPPQWDRYFGPGTGGVISHNDVPVDPSCVATANDPPAPIYAPPPATAPPQATALPQTPLQCPDVSGRVNRTGLGRVKLGTRRGGVLATLGSPQSTAGGLLRYCLARGGGLLVGESGRHPRTVFVSTTSPAFMLRGARGRSVAVGAAARSLRTAFPQAKPLLRVGSTEILQVAGTAGAPKTGRIIAAIAGGHVAYLGVYEPGAIRTARGLSGYLSTGA